MEFAVIQKGNSENANAKLDSQIRELVAQVYETIETDFAAVIFFNTDTDEIKIYTASSDRADIQENKYSIEFGQRLFFGDEISNLQMVSVDNSPPQTPFGRTTNPTFYGTKVFAKGNTDCGVFIASKSDGQIWTSREKQSLEFLAGALSVLLELNQTIVELRFISEENSKSKTDLATVEEQFAALARNVPGAIFRYTVCSAGGYRLEFMSPGCEKIWGYTAKEIEVDPKLVWKAVIGEDLEAMQASVQQSQDELSPWQHRWRIRCKDGFLKWLQGYGIPTLTPDGDVEWNNLILDVTVEQDAQISLAENTRLLHEAQKLESIGRLAGGVAHDFNNLLSVIMGNAEALKLVGRSSDEQESVKEIIEATQRGAVLVKQLLSFARKSDLRTKVAAIHSVLVGVDRLLRRVLPANISIEIIQRAGLWPVHIDRNMLENALLNLVINARDAMPEGGALTIETSNVRIDEEYVELRDEDVKPGRYVMVAITDTGTGIEESVMPYVFEPFYSTKGPTDGTGLGLAMVEGFVKQSGGIIRVYSEVGHGTSIKMYFPAVEGSEGIQGISESASPRHESRSSNVLLVEDQDAVRRTVEKVLVSAGYVVIPARSGDEAIAIYQDRYEEIDIIVTDVVMPGKIQGPHLVRLARKINNSLPVLYMSGYPHEANVHGNGIRSGDISLMKPVRRSDLLTAVSKLRQQI